MVKDTSILYTEGEEICFQILCKHTQHTANMEPAISSTAHTDSCGALLTEPCNWHRPKKQDAGDLHVLWV